MVMNLEFPLWLLLSSFATSSASGMVFCVRELFEMRVWQYRTSSMKQMCCTLKLSNSCRRIETCDCLMYIFSIQVSIILEDWLSLQIIHKFNFIPSVGRILFSIWGIVCTSGAKVVGFEGSWVCHALINFTAWSVQLIVSFFNCEMEATVVLTEHS